VGRIRGKNFEMLNQDPIKPLLNRAIMGTYPPGSTFKMANDMIGLQEGVLTTTTPPDTPVRDLVLLQSGAPIIIRLR
jgi:cell division protein FtsI/penicillin-binding protein 2